MRCTTFICCILFCLHVFAQPKGNGVVKGRVFDENDKPIQGVSIQILNKQKGTLSKADGSFYIEIVPNKPTALVFSHTGYVVEQRNYLLIAGLVQEETIRLKKKAQNLDEVVIKDEKERRETGRINIDASKSLLNPSPISGIESLIKVFVGSNNELTSSYSVRGGSYDENLIYVNDFEIFRPYLVRSGQQEGLSFINPALTGNVKFYNGGFQAKYGDKMSSVLDITYKKPKSFGGSAYIGLLEQGFHLEGTSDQNKVTYILGVRNRSNRNLLSTQETKGSYVPTSSDIQTNITYQASKRWLFELFGNTSSSKFTLLPEEAKLTSAVFSPLYTQYLGLDINFSGSEKDSYTTEFLGISATNQINKQLKLKWSLSRFNNHENENIDITGDYLFGELSTDQSSSSFGQITNPLGAGIYTNFARNTLDITVWNAVHKGSWDGGKHFLQWGNSIEQQLVTDKLDEWVYQDSAGYSLPNTSGNFNISSVAKGKANLNIARFSGYIQDNIQFKDSSDFVLQTGLRYNYNNLNNECILSPRMGISFKPKHLKKDIIFKASVGYYAQPPFYRELRRMDGSLNQALRAQKSWQLSGGLDYNFKMYNRPARLSTEVYYKTMWDVVPYNLDNVRIQYFGENNAKAYATGIETRLFTQLVKDAESWISLGFMKTMEKIDNYYYYVYKNAAGQIIHQNTTDKVVVDSSKINQGWVRRPTDRLITFGMFYQDYLSTNKNMKVYLNTIYGSNMPYNLPGSVKYRNALIIDPYIRVDVGFSALLLSQEKETRRRHSPFKKFESIWASFEVFNLINRANTISYMFIKDYKNDTYTIPNRLTPRLVNFKIVAAW